MCNFPCRALAQARPGLVLARPAPSQDHPGLGPGHWPRGLSLARSSLPKCSLKKSVSGYFTMLRNRTLVCWWRITATGQSSGNGNGRTKDHIISSKAKSAANLIYFAGDSASTTKKNDHSGYPFRRAPWALVTGVEPFN